MKEITKDTQTFSAGPFPVGQVFATLIAVGSLAVLTPQFAHAAGPETPGDLVVYWINFILFASLITYLIRKHFPTIWVERAKSISAAVSAAAADYREAEEALAEAEALHVRLEEECAALEAKLAQEALVESEDIRAQGKLRGEDIISRAKEGVRVEKLRAEQQLRDELSAQVLTRAEEILREIVSGEGDAARRASGVRKALSLMN